MTDTHDTNLPEKQAELEEEKQAVEVSEPADTETPAEEIESEKPAETAQKLTKEEILDRLKAIAANVDSTTKAEIDSLKQAFYKQHNAELEAARKQFLESGAEEEFIPQPDPAEEEFKSVMSAIKEKRNAQIILLKPFLLFFKAYPLHAIMYLICLDSNKKTCMLYKYNIKIMCFSYHIINQDNTLSPTIKDFNIINSHKFFYVILLYLNKRKIHDNLQCTKFKTSWQNNRIHI